MNDLTLWAYKVGTCNTGIVYYIAAPTLEAAREFALWKHGGMIVVFYDYVPVTAFAVYTQDQLSYYKKVVEELGFLEKQLTTG